MTQHTDTLIIGAGFAGLVAARELTQRGRSVVILEGRDRIGGRTWTDERLGRAIELGGTWVHALQPHVWAELSRYGLGTVPTPDPERVILATADGPRTVSPDEGLRLLDAGLGHVVAGARELIPQPFDPFLNERKVADLDEQTVADRLATLGEDADVRLVAEAFVATGFQAPADELSLAHVVRLAALCYWDTALDLEAASTFKIEGGTRALVEAIAADVRAPLHLDTRVASLSATGEGVTAVTTDGRVFEAATAIVTAPINALRSIRFEPALSVGKQRVVAAGQASRGVKVWARVRGSMTPFLGFASPADSPLHIAQYEYEVDGDTLVVAFGSDHTAISPDDRAGVEAALRRWLPDAEVVEVTGHDWTDDELSQETWANLRPGQMATGVPEFQRPESGIHFAGSDYSTGWLGYIDGAIETGLKVARTLLAKAD